MANFIKSDLEFILQQILIAEAHAAGTPLIDLLPNTEVGFGLRTVDGSFNNLIDGRTDFGAADTLFPRLLTPIFNAAEGGTSYTQTSGLVFDSQPRIISNLIVDQTANNPAAVAAAAGNDGASTVTSPGLDGIFGNADDKDVFLIPNIAPDEGLSAPFNQWMTFFGQFFDHGLDLVTKGGNGTVFMQLQPDDPLYVPGSPTNFMVLTRATQVAGPGADGILGTADDTVEHENTTSPFVDQNQTYGSHASQQVFLRAYAVNAEGKPVATGKLITNRDLGADGKFGTADDVEIGGMATWKVVKAQARDLLGINLTDADFDNVPLLATDQYGNFIKGPNGYAQVVIRTPGPNGILGDADDGTTLVEGTPLAPVDLTNAVRTGHQFLIDIAHNAVPVNQAGNMLTPDADTVAGGAVGAGFYDNELLDSHYIAGDGRVNENIGLTTVHHIFHSEHNRLVEQTKGVILGSGDLAFLNQWLLTPVAAVPANLSTLVWNGERLFQAAKLGTEMQYQHIVFEEFARTIQPQVDAFIDFDDTINPSIVAEFAHTVYRFGHSMLLETIDRLDPNFVSSEIGLIAAFLNPLEFAASGPTPDQAAGAIIRGLTRQVANEIDEFVTEALRNNVLGLPLDLAAINIARGRDTGVPSLNAARREFYAGTGDAQLKPYTSWGDFVLNIKHPESLINFIAAYGTHSTITAETTLDGKRAAASAIVLGGAGAPADRFDFLNSTGAWTSGANGVTTTGLDAIDFWIGGLAEAKMPFGGMLGSTFNFVFETQLEALQNGDRFYYLHRLAGLNFVHELEQNSFAELVMRNTDATHLPGQLFLTPGLILEVDQTKQFNAGLGSADPDSGHPLMPWVIRDNPATAGLDSNYLRYTGGEHVVLGGTAGNDILIGGIGDDTLYGDAGNDRLEGGHGNDEIQGGAGDDIITDMGGDDLIKGGDGNDVIHGGQGANLIIGGRGNDFIVTGEDSSEVIGGEGNDFILGSKMNVQMAGNEGDDWIEIGSQDGAPGDNFDPFGTDSVIGHDVFLGDGGFDEMIGEGGDDIMVGSAGPDKMKGMSGFDWATFKDSRFGVNVDFLANAFNETPIAAALAAVTTKYAQVEGLSGSAFADYLRGDHADAAVIATAGAYGSVLTNNHIDLITGLRAFLGTAAAGPDGILGTADDQFGAGNIILGGDGSDIIEGRGGDDLIDGDKWLNVRISVRANIDGSGPEIASFNSMKPMVPLMLNGTYNPGQLVIVRELMDGAGGYDTAMFTGNVLDYDITVNADGSVTVADTFIDGDGTDRLTNIERLQFGDGALVRDPGTGNFVAEVAGTQQFGNWAPGGLVQIIGTPTSGQALTASIAGVTDGDNTDSAGAIRGRVSYYWQVELVPGDGFFEDIVGPGGLPVVGQTFRVTPDLEGLNLRVRAIYQDQHGVLENVFSAPTADVLVGVAPGLVAPLPIESSTTSPGMHLIRSDLQFILDSIKIAEQHAAGADLLSLLPHERSPLGLRTVTGELNNLYAGQSQFGAADTVFPRLLDPVFNEAEPLSPTMGGDGVTPTSYNQTSGFVQDSQPRIISNLIVDQTANNPAAVAAAAAALAQGSATVLSPGLDGIFGTADDKEVFFLPNVAPDEGLSAPFNSWMTFFGQFFDHGLDLVTKGGNGTVFIPLQPDDPLFNPAPGAPNFMVLTRATQVNGPGADGILGNADDTTHEAANTTSPFVDQNQTYGSHPSQQVFLRAYDVTPGGPVSSGRLITNRDLGDGIFGNADDNEIGGMATWAVVKAQARDILGINLTDGDVFDIPLLATDQYGNFLKGPNGFPMIVLKPEHVGGPLDLGGLFAGLAEGNPAAPVNASFAVSTGHQFLIDIAHNAVPVNGQTGAALTADADDVAGPVPDGAGGFLPQPAGTYDNELLDAHYIAGDGRVNENIGLTAVHHIFHSEHNRMVAHTKDVVLASNDVAFINEWLRTPITTLPVGQAAIDALVWNGERLFQVGKFSTEMQYQHLVFEEFARTMQPQIDLFTGPTQGYDADIDASIVAEFAHTVYRFGHSMLTETIDRLDPNFVSSEIGLIAAFLNPLAFAASGPTPDEAAGALARGMTRQTGNAIDEFVTEALRNNVLGLPLDLAVINIARGRDTGIPSFNAARREFYNMTGDSQLKPYTSWVDLLQNLKHPASVINFIAAYGTHAELLAADVNTLVEMRAVATALVLGGTAIINEGTAEQRTFDADLIAGDRLDFLNSVGAYANLANGVTTTGVDAIDFWIGGLAEAIMPFGGMLGSTFNFVFETQLEALQNGDRFYYLDRAAGLNFVTELENNSFAKMVMNNTNATHLPGLIFLTPGFILEADQSKQFNAGLGNADPLGDVMRDNPNTAGPDANYLHYTGGEHVVLGGTDGNDTLIGGIGDDTIWGDAGNDRLEGGDGNDMIRGGDGDDIITDRGGDDNIQGDGGNDVIHGGNGVNLILGGFGQDFIINGEDSTESFGGPGNDFILGSNADEQNAGNEGDDWLEGGHLDGSPGDNFDPLGLDLVVGNDVYIGSGGPDIMNGEGGDDIMVGSAGPGDKYIGASGFDWATFKDDLTGVNIDLNVRAANAAPGPVAAGILARFKEVEGLSGSKHSDILQGDDADAAVIATAGAQGSVLTNIALINGLQALLDNAIGDGINPVTSFGAGNIILGGDGSDIIEGRAGDDIIDGDKWLNVRISVRAGVDANGLPTGPEIATYDSMRPMIPLMLSGFYNPGQLQIVREILPGSGGFNFDTAAYSGLMANYTIIDRGNGNYTVIDNVGTDGVDQLSGIERLQFNDQSAVLVAGLNNEAVGLVSINDNTPEVGSLLSAGVEGVTDADNPGLGRVTGPVSYYWQADFTGTGLFENITTETGVGLETAVGKTFRVTADVSGLQLRVKAIYKDANGVLETVFSAVTDPVSPIQVNDAPVGTMLISDTTPNVGQLLTATRAFTDPDGPANPVLSFQWQSGNGGVFSNIAGATTATFTPTLALAGQQLRVRVTYTDDFGTLETVTSVATSTVLNLIVGTAGNDVLNGTAFADEIQGLGGNDTLNGLGGNDLLGGGEGNDRLNGGAGADTMVGGVGDDIYWVDHVGDQVIELTGEGIDQVRTTLTSYTLGANVENLWYYGTESFTGSGNELDNIMISGAGDDRLNGRAGADRMVGGAGDDIYWVDDAGDIVIEQAGEGLDQVRTTLTSYTLAPNVENLWYYGTESFTGSGNALDNIMISGAGDDRLNGRAGADRMVGGAGDDIYWVDDAGDIVIERAGEGLDQVRTTLTSYTLAPNVENLWYYGMESFTGSGNALDNIMISGAGDDRLNGRAGADRMVGGAGDDIYWVDDTGDIVIERAGEGLDQVRTTLSSYTLGANVENLWYYGTESFTGTGNALDNIIQGSTGNDRLNGGAGNDMLIGGGGNDIFVFGPNFGNDRIMDFDANPVGGQDLLNIAAFNLNGATFASRVAITDAGADTLVTINGADGGSITLVGVTNHTTVTIADFQLA
ncbi:peroxidase family protein [Pseudomonas sp. CC6-YY-74]|uniref:peroxidase family protein n=1 Tax=Pseudomonas sp. CC6-YY-74 TaxID=1930532 RepID=UPI0009A1F701|nr:peroxidase family protein [Pseudomonas sp. CC6-YY-74]